MFKRILFACLIFMACLQSRAGAEEKALFTVCVNRECGYVDGAGRWAVKPRFFAANPFDADGLAWVQEGDRIGRINTKGEWVMEPVLSYAGEYKDGLAWAETAEGGYGFLNTKGEWAIEPVLSHAADGMSLPDDFKDGLARAGKRIGQSGYINTKGEWVVPPKFQWIGDFSPNGLAFATTDIDHFGYINKKGEWVIEPVFRRAEDFNPQGLAKVAAFDEYIYDEKDGKRFLRKREPDDTSPGSLYTLYGIINTNGEWVISPTFQNMGESVAPNGLISAEIDGSWGYINMKGEQVIKLYSALPPKEFNESGQAWARFGGSWGYIDEKEGWLVQPAFDSISDFSNGLAAVEKNGQYGLINMKGEWVVEPAFERLGDFSGLGDLSDGLIAASKDGGNYGYINTRGEWVIEPVFSFARNFADGLAIAAKGGRFGFINTKGEWIVQPMFAQLASFEPNGLIRMLYDEPEGDALWVERVDRTGASRLLLGYEQNAERAVHWEYDGDTRYLCNENGQKLLSIQFTCGQETARNMNGEIIWPEKSEAELREAAQTACFAAGIRKAFY